MPSVAYGNTLTDLGRNIAEQKASEQALAGILAQVGASKLAALNALAANRGRTQAERDVGMDRNATTRQVALLESALRAQELADRERMARESITAAENLARLEGTNRLAVAGVPYGPDALEMTKALARLQAGQLNPRVAESHYLENAERNRANQIAAQSATTASGLANFAYQDFIAESKGWGSDKKAKAKYDAAIKAIIAQYGDKASMVMLPDGRVKFTPLVLPPIQLEVPANAVPPPAGNPNAIPPPDMGVPQMQGVAPAPPPPMVVPRPGVAELRMADEMAVPRVVAANAAITDYLTQDAPLRSARPLRPASRISVLPVPAPEFDTSILDAKAPAILTGAKFRDLIPQAMMGGASARQFEQASLAERYVGNLVRELGRISGMPPNRGSAQRAQLLQSELARVKAILSSQ